MNNSELNNILSNFDVNPSKFTYEKINTGYINDSYFVNVDNQKKYVLQKINTNIFKNIDAIRNNINLSISNLKDSGYHRIKFVEIKHRHMSH